MVRKKIDNKIRVLIENGVKLGHRTLFVLVGDKGKEQVVILHHMLAKAEVKARPPVLWCFKNDLGFSSHRAKRMKKLQRNLQMSKNLDQTDPFDLFLSSTKIRFCYYSETHKILGNTYGMCILQDFEALTPNLLARTIETVEGGGLIVILLKSVTSLKQLYTMCMDVHQRFRTEAHQNVVGRFNERFLLSLADGEACKRSLFVDDDLTVLRISKHNLSVTPVESSQEASENDIQLEQVKKEMQDTQPVGSVINCCKTLDQAKALLKFVEAISEKTLRTTVSLTAARGRGKSATLGLAVATAISFGYSNIFVTSPSPENLKTFFEFVEKGLDVLEYNKVVDYSVVESTNPEFNKAVVRINVTANNRQIIQYIHPTDCDKLSHADLLVIDEAAAIPLPCVKSMLGPYLVFLASTINGYEGTGRSLSLKLLEQLREQTKPADANTNAMKKKSEQLTSGRTLHEITLEESIRYKPGDEVERWLNKLLCLDATTAEPILSGIPVPDSCDLYYINRDSLFSYHPVSEVFLHKMMSLFVSSHYKNTPNDLQMMSDAPAHHLFCLLGPTDPNRLPDILVVIQVCLEGEISKSSVVNGLSRGKGAAGDLIPWTVGQQFNDSDFPQLSGARIVRIATHPDFQSKGYGAKALEILKQYYEFKFPSINDDEAPQEIATVDEEEVELLEETIEPKSKLPPLLLKLSERVPEKLNYLGVSFGLTEQLLKFWKRSGYVPVYLRQTSNDLTGEHSCIMLNVLHSEEGAEKWISAYWKDFRTRFVKLLAREFNKFPPSLGLGVLTNKRHKMDSKSLDQTELRRYMMSYDIQRLENYSKNLIDYHMILDLLNDLGRMYFLNEMGDVHLSAIQAAILLGTGLQNKTIETVSSELGLPVPQLLGLFNQLIRKCVRYFNDILKNDVEKNLKEANFEMTPLVESLQEELEKGAKKLKEKQKKELKHLNKEDLAQFAIKGEDEEWVKALAGSGKKKLISVKSTEKRLHEKVDDANEEDDLPKMAKKKKKKQK